MPCVIQTNEGGFSVEPVPFEATRYTVTSRGGRREHLVDMDYEGAPGCSCEDFMCRERECKHIRAVRQLLTFRQRVNAGTHIQVSHAH